MRCVLREVRGEDLAVLFEQWADPVAARMAAFTAPDHMDRDAFERRWSRLRADETVIARAIVVDREVAGTIASWGDRYEREVTYWIGRSYWGKGIATGALNAFLAVDQSRPLHARVAYDNFASHRVLQRDRRTRVTAMLLPKVTRRSIPRPSTWTPDSAWLWGRRGKRGRSVDVRTAVSRSGSKSSPPCHFVVRATTRTPRQALRLV
jgi:hypothetical protein